MFQLVDSATFDTRVWHCFTIIFWFTFQTPFLTFIHVLIHF